MNIHCGGNCRLANTIKWNEITWREIYSWNIIWYLKINKKEDINNDRPLSDRNRSNQKASKMYSGEFDGAAAFAGGGFMPSQATTVPDPSSSFSKVTIYLSSLAKFLTFIFYFNLFFLSGNFWLNKDFLSGRLKSLIILALCEFLN